MKLREVDVRRGGQFSSGFCVGVGGRGGGAAGKFWPAPVCDFCERILLARLGRGGMLGWLMIEVRIGEEGACFRDIGREAEIYGGVEEDEEEVEVERDNGRSEVS